MEPNVLGLLITNKCTIRCRHCCNDSHPLAEATMAFEDLVDYLSTASEISSLQEIGISGGEAFLFIPLLRKILRLAANRNLSASITTNGFWASSLEQAELLLADLKVCGLKSLNISTSVFHQEFINVSRVITAATAALRIGLIVRINYVSTSSTTVETLKNAIGDLAGKVEIVSMPCLPSGRGAVDVDEYEFDQQLSAPIGNCFEDFKKMVIEPSGDVYPCCSPGGFTPPLRLGNVKNSSLGFILETAKNNRLLSILEKAGPGFFLPFLRRAIPNFPEHFSDRCHLCNFIMSTDQYEEIIHQAIEQLFTEMSALDPNEIW
jgi:MoaA/NifB/PqqE/SkfB family radical SAM enzyme